MGRKNDQAFLSYIVMAGLFFFLLPVAAAQTAEAVQVTIQASSLNVRLGPGTEYWSQGKIISGTKVSVLAADRGWLLVRLADGSSGWILGSFTSNPHAAPLLSFKEAVTARTTISNLSIRTGPGALYTSFDQLAAATEVQVLSEENGWLLVQLRFGSTGWVSKNYVQDASIETAETTVTGTGLKGKIIALDPGHGGWNTGATGVTGLREKVVNFQTTEKLAYYLREQGASVVMTRTGDYEVSLAERVNICHNRGAHIFISIHNNAHTNRIYSGTETYYYNRGANAASSRRLATLVQQELVRTSGLRSIGVHHGTFYVIRTPRIPSILVEIAFLSNRHDESLLRQDSFLDGQARAMTRAIISYFQ